MSYTMEFSREAVRDIDEAPETLRPAVGQALAVLAVDPRPPGSEESATEGLRQVQAGECRVVYEADDEAGVVTVWAIERVDREGRSERMASAEGFEFTVRGRPRRATRQRVIEAMREAPPGPEAAWMVEVEGTAYPVLQVLVEAFGIAQAGVSSERAARILERLGFPVSRRQVKATRRHPKVTAPLGRTMPLWRRERHGQDLITQPVEIPVIVLHWSYQWRWEEIAGAREDSRDIDLPPGAPGVYDVRAKGRYETLYIGQTSDLMRRVYYGLVQGVMPHVAGDKIRENENLADLSVRWAYTDRPAAVEEELHRLHIETFGYPPTYAGRR